MAETLTAPAAGSTQPQSAPEQHEEKKVKRQIVSFTLYKIMPEWRRLPESERTEHKRQFAAILKKWEQPGRFVNLTYSTVGTRGDCDMVLWRICYSVEELNQMTAELMASPLAAYLQTPYHYLAMTKRSAYQIGPKRSGGQTSPRGDIIPGEHKYLFIYPFLKTRPWYQLPLEERKRLMGDHIRIGLSYPRVKLNTTYSFGLDDQEFVVAFETDYLEDFLDLVQDLREIEISMYTLRDTPIFTCIHMPAEEMLNRLG